MSKHTIEIRGLTKKFGSFKALNGFELTVEQGTIHGFLGPNGAGKSTAIRTMLGVLHPDSGTVRVLNSNPRREPQVLRRVGYVPGDVALWPSLSAAETFRALERLRRVTIDPRREAELIEKFSLDPRKRIRDLSTGNRRKVSLIAAFAPDTELLILDEPTAGLDPLMEQIFVAEVRAARERGSTILLSSHIMSEVEKLCDNVTVIKEGRAVESGSLEQLKHLSRHLIQATLPDGSTFTEAVDADKVPTVLREILDRGATAISATPASIEEILLSHYESGEP